MKNNNLILVNIGSKKYYYTSANKAGKLLGIQPNSINWAIIHKNELLYRNNKVIIELIDGSDIPYKYINNEQ